MLTLVYVHGWALEPAIWEPLRRRLPWPDRVLDAGYFGPEDLALPEGPRVAVGHSLGLMRALEWGGFDAYVSVGGFARFARAEDLPEGVAPRVLSRMAQRFEVAPDRVLADFRVRSGARPDLPGPPHRSRLASDLARLARDDLRARLPEARPRWVVAGDADPIVPPALCRAQWGEPDQWVAGGGHLLPLTHPEALAAGIGAFLEGLS